MGSFGAWLIQRTARDADAVARTEDLYADYEAYSRRQGPRVMSRRAFADRLSEQQIGPGGRDHEGFKLRRGLRLLPRSTDGAARPLPAPLARRLADALGRAFGLGHGA